ncbi:MAG: M60 family metallopeptidase [Planctomycetota bacterium]
MLAFLSSAALSCSAALNLAPQAPLRLDLAADTDRQVVVDREAGQYLGHVSTILLADGASILAAYPKGHGRGAIVMKRSPDGGKTWSDRLPTPSSWATSREVPTLHRVVDADGNERLLLWSGLYPARFALADEDGRHWSELRPAGDWGGIVVMGDVVAMHAPGRYLAFFHDDGRFLAADGKASGTMTLLQTESTDGGQSWGKPRALWSGSDIHLCEPGAVRSPDGSELTLLLRENRRRQPSHFMVTRDEGATWTEPRPLHASLTGDRHTVRYAPDGRVVAVFRDVALAPDHPSKGDFVAWVGRYDDLAAGRPGQYVVRLLDNKNAWDCGYPGLEVLADGTFVATTYGHWTAGEPPYIVSVRFTLAELDAMAAQREPQTRRPGRGRARGRAGVTGGDLEAALAALEGYRPTRAAPTEPAVVEAVRALTRAMPRLVATDSAVARRLATLWQERSGELRPAPAHKIHVRDPLARVLVRFDDERTLRAAIAGVRPHPAASTFPGSVPEGATPIARTARVDLAVPGRHSLGVYAAPGARVTLRFAADGGGTAALPAGLRVRIGAHSDDIQRRDAWPRMPRVSRVFAVEGAQVEVAHAFGGLVYVEVAEASSGVLAVTVDGAVAAPYFLLGETDPAAWRDAIRAAPAPWAELATDRVVLTVPSSAVRALDDPTAVLEFWNRVADAAADLASRPRTRTRPERYVADVEISAGSMHAGYPIMTHLGAAATMVDLEKMQAAPWGLFHELGHNHQSKHWTFAGTGEVTVNLFSLYLCETMCGRSWREAWGGNLVKASARLESALAAGTAPWGGAEGKADLALRLLMYVQIQQAFGWDALQRVFADYRDAPAAALPADDQSKRDQWLVRLSRTVGKDLGPFFAAWGVPVSEAARAAVAELPDWMPPDWPRR